MSAQGKQPRAPRKALPCVVGLHHAESRLRSPGLRMVESAQSPDRAQQMAGQITMRKPGASAASGPRQAGNGRALSIRASRAGGLRRK
jgi:hypothetical protein